MNGRTVRGEEVRLERRLVLASWFSAELGYASPKWMLGALREYSGAWAERHPALGAILNAESFRKKGRVSAESLLEYDQAIRADWAGIIDGRGGMELKYFQYLAALAAEHFLAKLSSGAGRFAEELDRFAGFAPHGRLWPRFRGAEDLDKLALWMATGSGKTLLMHLHYRQFMRRGPFAPDGVILLTPNESLSAQHLEELRASGIPCFRHGEGADLYSAGPDAVRILEATKLRTGDKPGRGATEGTDSFEGRNLVFADEGHRGAGGEKFVDARRDLSRGGFCFEYSATFGQALWAAGKAELAAEYGRAILFDYSYKHFHADRYGKDFRVLNLSKNPTSEQKDALMLGNLLSFCQQRMLFADNQAMAAEYNLESPLLLLLGSTVIGGPQAGENEANSDLAWQLLFLNRVMRDNGGKFTEMADDILRGKSDIPLAVGEGAFAGRLNFLRDKTGKDGALAMKELRRHVFNSERPSSLRLCPVKSAPGEIGLSADGSPPFGLAYVGEPARFRQMVLTRGQEEGVRELEDQLGGSLFARINRPDSRVSVLMGAKKFMEGWSSWRVSGMGLLNVGVGEGSQIIQLFGRGVRLKGRDMSLKRSSGGTEEAGGVGMDGPPLELAPLETLNIFGLRADFLEHFGKFLSREDVGGVTLEAPIRASDSVFEGRGLLVPKLPSAEAFSETVVMLEGIKDGIRATLDLSTRVVVIEGGSDWDPTPVAQGEAHGFTDKIVPFLDMADLRRRLAQRKSEAGLYNLLLPEAAGLERILLERCRVIAPDFGPPKSFAEARELGDIAFSVLWRFAERLHRVRRERWRTAEMEYEALESSKSGDFPQSYSVQVKSSEAEAEVRGLLARCEELYKGCDWMGASALPRVYFSRHLYQPLLAEGKNVKHGSAGAEVLFPPALNAGEREFVVALRAYLKDNGVPEGKYFLLRNLSRGRGVGFFMESGFYPDFILWVKRNGGQRIIFIEPHGLLLGGSPGSPKFKDKADLYEFLAERSAELAEIDSRWRGVRMDSYVISQTDLGDLQMQWGVEWTEEKLKAHHILFPKRDHRHIKRILEEA